MTNYRTLTTTYYLTIRIFLLASFILIAETSGEFRFWIAVTACILITIIAAESIFLKEKQEKLQKTSAVIAIIIFSGYIVYATFQAIGN